MRYIYRTYFENIFIPPRVDAVYECLYQITPSHVDVVYEYIHSISPTQVDAVCECLKQPTR